MPEGFDYSLDALNVINQFHDAEILMYVEGEDDVPFWEFIMNYFCDIEAKVKPVGGKPQLDSYSQKVFRNQLDAIIAMDADFSFLEHEVSHPKILKTKGHSIENSIVCPRTMKEVIRVLAKVSRRQILEIDCLNWLHEFQHAIEKLTLVDIYNHAEGLGEAVMSDNCARFLRYNSANLCPQKIENYLNDIGIEINEEAIANIQACMAEKGVRGYDLIRGHFLLTGVHKFIIKKVESLRKKIPVPNDVFFGAMIQGFEKTFSPEHPHFEHYKHSIEELS